MNLNIATLDEIRAGKVTDVYFDRTMQVLQAEGVDRRVVVEITASSLPRDYAFGLLAGLDELVAILEGLPVDVDAMPEGSLFYPGEPVVRVSGQYLRFGALETAVLGVLCQASGIATKAMRCKLAAADRAVISFGARRMHPAIAPMVERSAYVGGCDGVAVVKSAELLGIEPTGTMPHALILLMGGLPEALRAFHRVVPPTVGRVALIDTFTDEKFGAVEAAETLGADLAAVRLDTPGSRRGNLAAILAEVRWELDLAGFGHVKLFVSGDMDEYQIPPLNDLVAGYGVGTAITNAPVINFALDIVEIEGAPISKRGKKSGVKEVLVCDGCGARHVVPVGAPPDCPTGGPASPALRPLLRQGTLVTPLPPVAEVRTRALAAARAGGSHGP